MRGALSRGEGCAITVTEYAIAVLYNGLGQYQLALEAAAKAAAADEVVTSSWALYELVEAASRCGREAVARDAAERLCERASPRGTEWAKGTVARCSALVEPGEAADELHGEAIDPVRAISHVGPPSSGQADLWGMATSTEPTGRGPPTATPGARHVGQDGRSRVRRACTARTVGHR